MKTYLFCYFHQRCGGHLNHHHVLISKGEEVDSFRTKHYRYILKKVEEVSLSDEDRAQLVIKHLVMDGESLLKRIKKSKKQRKTIYDEST